ncbi:hypothetical protein [Roseivirga misakiensis]|uniref:Uncharacterized protein n=1 Tax=Roseivirga misakiensis TaxID=1563681 RepID=A0A1E5SK26_9BACT|nr:hypothetical protein [Roseivirga misakiensis]OEJ99477.1 hypothetical protein BFP71_07785 [Roseivirga misakiensis]
MHSNVVGNYQSMNTRLPLILICALLIYSCEPEENPNDIIQQAINVYLSTDIEEKNKIDSSLFLTNKTLKIDNQNFDVLSHKATLLFRKKDLSGLIQLTNEMIDLRPDHPIYVRQQALLLEIQSNMNEAQQLYKKSIAGYQKLIKTDPNNFDLLLEYYGSLEASGDSIGANSLLVNLRRMELEDYQIEILDQYKNQYISKNEFIKFWKGEINYDQLGGKE